VQICYDFALFSWMREPEISEWRVRSELHPIEFWPLNVMNAEGLCYTKIRLLLVEDNRLLREGLTGMLNEQPDIEVLAAFGNGKEAVLKATQELNPQIILLDLGLKGQNSLRLVEAVKKDFSEANVIVMDLMPVQADMIEFVKAGISGFILKEATFEDFVGTIRWVAAGVSVLPPP
jgi:DNA-binding NarL/FixJ family response regulator